EARKITEDSFESPNRTHKYFWKSYEDTKNNVSLDEVERTLQEGGFFDLGSSILIKLVEKNPLNLTEQELRIRNLVGKRVNENLIRRLMMNWNDY
ncbi:MAG: hypothetical protein M1114_00875, partial [Candidatus Dependentiae bacterium]|nr:hypothetical protein [Candidatus Dependentiae bacterium]